MFCSLTLQDDNQKNISLSQKSLKGLSCSPDQILSQRSCYSFHWYPGNYSSFLSVKEICKSNHAIAFAPDSVSFPFLPHKVPLLNSNLSHSPTVPNSFPHQHTNADKTSAIQVPLSAVKGFAVCQRTGNINVQKSTIILCKNGGYISALFLCDGYNDCPNDQSDEIGCICTWTANDASKMNLCREVISSDNTTTCGTFYYKTAQNTCEKYTNVSLLDNSSQQDENTTGIFKCTGGKLIHALLVDDLLGDCENSEDEPTILSLLSEESIKSCPSPELIPCLPGHSKCFNITQICIYKLDSMKNLHPCRNGGHLKNCSNFECNAQFKCFQSYCIPWAYVCDGRWDCPFGHDENYEPVCGKQHLCFGMYKCRHSSTCLHLANLCDGVQDCPYQDDEFNCKLYNSGCLERCQCLLFEMQCFRTRPQLLALGKSYPHISLSFLECILVDLQNFLIFPRVMFLKVVQSNLQNICPLYFSSELRKTDFNTNKIQTIARHCFVNLKKLQIIQLDHNMLSSVESQSFLNLSSLVLLSLSQNYIILLCPHFTDSAISIFVLINTTIANPESLFLEDLSLATVVTKDYSVCCLVPSSSLCTMELPWYESCGRLLPDQTVRAFYAVISSSSWLGNIVSLICGMKTRKQNKTLSTTIVFINFGDMLCTSYVTIILIADILYGGNFVLQKQVWRSGLLCFVSFGIILWFTMMTQVSLFVLAFSRLMLVVFPITTKFKNSKFVRHLFISLFLGCFSVSLFLVVYLKFSTNVVIFNNLCLPFVDPTHSMQYAVVLTMAVFTTQFITSLAIVALNILLVHKVNQSDKAVSKTTSGTQSKIFLIFHLFTVSFFHILCWSSTNGVFITALFLPKFSITLIFWTTILLLPLNSLINPLIFSANFVRKGKKGGMRLQNGNHF